MALNAYLTLKGQKQGDIHGSVVQKGREGSIMVIAVDHQVMSPRDPASGLRVTAVQRSGNNLNITFSLAIPGNAYRLESKNSLSDPAWNSILGVADFVPSLSGPGQFTDPSIAGASKRFYRVRLLP